MLKGGGVFQPVSREGTLVLNNLLLTTACLTVLLGTLYPLFLDAVTGEKVSVGPPYFNATFVPLMTPLVAALAIGPMMAWKRGDLTGILKRLRFVAMAAFVAAVATLWAAFDISLLAVLGMVLVVWLGFGVLWEMGERVKLFRVSPGESWRRARGLPRASFGMSLAHLGVALMVLGITASETWQEEIQTIMRPGDTQTVGDYDLTFVGAQTVPGPNYESLTGAFVVTRDGQPVTVLQPEMRTFTSPPMETTEAAIRSNFAGDLYTVLGEPDGQGGYAVRLYYKPLVIWIWLGTLFMVAGGLVSLSDRRHRIGAPARRAAQAPGDAAIAGAGD
jgi:cytochrome c-type biogenesis protein CcmF